MALKSLLFAAGAAALLSGAASAQQYVSASAGFNFQADSDNAGAFTRDFVTGDGVAVPAGAILPSGTTVGWTTEFDAGLFAAAAYGWRFADTFRIEAELSYASADVDTHVGVQAGGGALGGADAAVLITGSPALGVTVADLVADGQGDISSFGYAINGYYDFAIEELPFDLYAGLGMGFAELDIDYSPSGVTIIDDTEMVGFLQLMAGGSYPISETTDVFAGYRFRQFGDAEADSGLIPATLDIENTNHILEFGVRFSF
jgi:opacity protein-like surface antigen